MCEEESKESEISKSEIKKFDLSDLIR